MKKNILYSALIIVIIVTSSFSIHQSEGRLSLKMESKRVAAGKLVKVNADIFYSYSEGRIVSHYTYPTEYVFLSNNKGEAKIYYPSENKVYLRQSQLFSSENELLFFFTSNQTFDLGLKDLGFNVSESYNEDNILVIKWTPPLQMLEEVSLVEMAYEEHLPIFVAFYDKNGKITKKTYYSDYHDYSNFVLPIKITEIVYGEKGDSIVSRKTFSDIKVDAEADDSYFNFSIPANARIINN